MTRDPTDGGWILITSEIVRSPVFRGSPDAFRLWILLLTSAHRHREPFRVIGRRTLEYGELITSTPKLAKKLIRKGDVQEGEPAEVVLSRPRIRRWLLQFRDDGMIELETSKGKGTWIRIVNFEKYQDFETYLRGRRQAYTPEEDDGPVETEQNETPRPLSVHAPPSKRTGKRTDQDEGNPAETEQQSLEGVASSVQPSVQGRTRAYTPGMTTPSSPIKKKKDPPPGKTQGVPPLDFNYSTGHWNRKPTKEELRIWRAAFPAVDFESEMAKATLYLMDLRPNKRKKRHGQFLRNWFSIAQDRNDKYGTGGRR